MYQQLEMKEKECLLRVWKKNKIIIVYKESKKQKRHQFWNNFKSTSREWD